jgi:hypothetical protein
MSKLPVCSGIGEQSGALLFEYLQHGLQNKEGI